MKQIFKTTNSFSQELETPKQSDSVFFRSFLADASDLPSSVLWTLTLLFLALTAVNMFHHEMWRDELQPWMIVRDSSSLFDLFRSISYEGHPALWHLLLFSVSRFTRNPVYMQLLHALIATTGVYVFLRFATFPRFHKILFVFGFFPFYQYAVISRCYGLGLLLVFIFCALYPEREKRLIPLAITLFLLANTSAYGWMTALPLSLVLVVDWFFGDRARNQPVPCRKTIVISAAIVLVGLGVAAFQMRPPPDSGFATGWNRSVDYKHAKAASAGIILACMPEVSEIRDEPGISGPFGWRKLLLIPYAYFALALVRKPIACLAYLSTGSIFLTFQFLKYHGYIWHHGHYFIALIASVWLAQHYAETRFKWHFVETLSQLFNRMLWPALLLLLTVHVAKASEAILNDWFRPYTSARTTAEFIQQPNLASLPVVGDVDYAASPVGAYLDAPMYYPRSKRWGTYTIWDQTRLTTENKGWLPIGESELYHQSMQLAVIERRDILLVLNYALKNTMWCISGAELLYVSEPAMVESERFFVYRLPYRRLDSHSTTETVH